MKNWHTFAVLLATGCALTAGAPATDAPASGSPSVPPDARAIFRAQKCAFCHAVPAEEGEAEDAESSDAGARAKLSDLSTTGATWTIEALRVFLLDGEEVDGRGHVTRFDGSEEEWSALSAWLLGLGAPRDSTCASSVASEQADSLQGGLPAETPDEDDPTASGE